MKQLNALAIIFLAFFMGYGAQAQIYQLPNGGFEQWDGTSSTAIPLHWNTFSTADGSYASLASTNHHYRRSGGRPGTEGSAFLTIYTKSILGIKANGNFTTGRIHAGAMSTSSSSNYNYTQRSNSAHSCPFTATPDSMYLWVSFYAASPSDTAGVTCYIHGDNDFRDPNDWYTPALYCGRAQARFARTTASPNAYGWQEFRVPFTYDGLTSPHYALVSLATNKTPGGGAAGDSLSIDDIRFVYSSWLTALAVDGQPLPGFQKDLFTYHLYGYDDTSFHGIDIMYTREADDATVAIDTLAADTLATYTLTVTAEDLVTTHTYQIHCHIRHIDPETPQYQVLAESSDPTMGTVSGGGYYAEGDTAVLTASPLPNHRFLMWNDSLTDNPRLITVLSDTLLLAHFAPTAAIAAPAAEPLSLYPNPAADYVVVNSEQGIVNNRLEIIDLQGRTRLVFHLTSPRTTLDLTPLPAGTYFVKCGPAVKKLIVK